MDPYILKELNKERAARRAVIHVVDLSDGRDRIIGQDDAIPGEIGAHAVGLFTSGKSGSAEIAGTNFFFNVHLPPPRLVVIGAVHISQALAPMAVLAGFDLTIIDPRTAFATKERFPGITIFDQWPEQVLAQHPLDRWTGLAAITHDPKIDDPPLVAALAAGAFYVGGLGSRKTHARRVERLQSLGVKDDAIARINAPIGLDIGAASPAEIAVAILAAAIAALRGRGRG